jgi:hypothetical protein
MKILSYIFLIFIFLAPAYCAMAQGGGPPPPDGGGGPGTVFDVPINFLVYPFLVLGVYLGLRFSAKSKR